MKKGNIYLLGAVHICDPDLNKDCTKEGCYRNGFGCYLTNDRKCEEKRLNFKLLQTIMKDNDIPEDVGFISDSGWECGDSEMMGLWYNAKENLICFTQNISDDKYLRNPDWEFIIGSPFHDNERCNKEILEKYLKVRGRKR